MAGPLPAASRLSSPEAGEDGSVGGEVMREAEKGRKVRSMSEAGQELGDGRRRGLWKARPVVAWAAKRMRDEPTAAEARLWQALRLGRLDGLHFRRQHPMGRFILDFYCAGRRLAVELDGPIHDTMEHDDRDRERDRRLQEHGITVLRFSNEAVLEHLPAVLQAITAAATSLPSTPSLPAWPHHSRYCLPPPRGRTAAKRQVGASPLPTPVRQTVHPNPSSSPAPGEDRLGAERRGR